METISRLDHDHIVRQQALKFLADGYSVKARVEGWFEPPETINGYRPDVIAICGGLTIIIEVKKGPVDWPKISSFKRYEQQHPSCKLVVVTP